VLIITIQLLNYIYCTPSDSYLSVKVADKNISMATRFYNSVYNNGLILFGLEIYDYKCN